jgi:hypothetical protein
VLCSIESPQWGDKRRETTKFKLKQKHPGCGGGVCHALGGPGGGGAAHTRARAHTHTHTHIHTHTKHSLYTHTASHHPWHPAQRRRGRGSEKEGQGRPPGGGCHYNEHPTMHLYDFVCSRVNVLIGNAPGRSKTWAAFRCLEFKT